MAKVKDTQVSSLTQTRPGLSFWCPGCNLTHGVSVAERRGPEGWEFNGDYDKPTLSPSVLVRFHDGERNRQHVCHSFVRDGQIQFLGDSTHHLAGQTVELPEWPFPEADAEGAHEEG